MFYNQGTGLAPAGTRPDLDKQYPYTGVGSEMIVGCQTTKLEISLPGGLANYLWIDTLPGRNDFANREEQ